MPRIDVDADRFTGQFNHLFVVVLVNLISLVFVCYHSIFMIVNLQEAAKSTSWTPLRFFGKKRSLDDSFVSVTTSFVNSLASFEYLQPFETAPLHFRTQTLEATTTKKKQKTKNKKKKNKKRKKMAPRRFVSFIHSFINVALNGQFRAESVIVSLVNDRFELLMSLR